MAELRTSSRQDDIDEAVRDRDSEWNKSLERFSKNYFGILGPYVPKEAFPFLEKLHSVVTADMREQVKFAEDTKTLVQKGSTAELNEHREYKANVRVLLHSILFELTHTPLPPNVRPFTEVIQRIEQFLKE